MNASPHVHELNIWQGQSGNIYVEYGDASITVSGMKWNQEKRIKKACVKAKRRHDKRSVDALNLPQIARDAKAILPGWCE